MFAIVINQNVLTITSVVIMATFLAKKPNFKRKRGLFKNFVAGRGIENYLSKIN